MESGRMRRAGYSLLLTSTMLSAGCSLLPQHENGTEEYCLSAGHGQAFDCARPAEASSAEPLRIRSLPIDDETLEAPGGGNQTPGWPRNGNACPPTPRRRRRRPNS